MDNTEPEIDIWLRVKRTLNTNLRTRHKTKEEQFVFGFESHFHSLYFCLQRKEDVIKSKLINSSRVSLVPHYRTI